MSFKTKQKLNAILIFSLNEFRFFFLQIFLLGTQQKKPFSFKSSNEHTSRFFSNLLLKTQLFGLFLPY